ncbi:hypothetical protein GWN26_06860 [Candidatus Saccharibacteria bacterium]|nr:hypothetical protein [Candidatus Saccharibacteria bacterium]
MSSKNMVIFGGIGLIIGALLPWGTATAGFSRMSIFGFEGNGVITGGIGLVLVLVGLVKKPNPGKSFFPLGGIILLYAGYIVIKTMFNIGFIGNDALGIAQIGSGLYISVVSVFIGLFGSLT